MKTVLITGGSRGIGRAMVDSVVEPHRKQFIPGFDELRAKVLEAGALSVNISGSGPSVFAVSSDMDTASKVGEIMSNHFADMGIGSCWVGWFNYEQVAKGLDLPDNVRVAALLPMGYPAENAQPLPLHEQVREFADTITVI